MIKQDKAIGVKPSDKSFIQIKNNNGPKRDPQRTPVVMFTQERV